MRDEDLQNEVERRNLKFFEVSYYKYLQSVK